MTILIRVKPNAAVVEAVEVERWGPVPVYEGLRFLQNAVDGSIECVYPLEAVMAVNEEGKLRGLPFNPVATRIGHTTGALPVDDIIVGTAILYGSETAETDSGAGVDLIGLDAGIANRLLAAGSICPRCLGPTPRIGYWGEYPGALSRTDNETEICSTCGTVEAMEQMTGSLTPQAFWATGR